jgi:uncharacterized phage protein (TIGR02218 family)
MKRLMPPGLVSFLQQNSNCSRADLFFIALKNGQTIAATDGQQDITLIHGLPGWAGGTTPFSATQFGRWSRGTITSEAGFSMNTNTMPLTCVPQPGTLFPGMTATGVLAAAANGLFDVADINVLTAYMPSNAYGNVSNGVETKFVGKLLKINKLNRIMVEFECSDPLYLLGDSNKFPSKTFTSGCPWSYGDGNCNPVGGIKTQSLITKTGSTAYVITPTVATGNFATANFYTQGTVKFTSGNNSGLIFTVKSHTAGGSLTLDMPCLVAPAAGDTFIVTAGCDKTATTCTQKFGNLSHFGGFTEIPPPVNAV